jgi:hypothetical protein
MHASIQKVPVRYRTDRPWTQEIMSLVKDIATTPMDTMVALAFVVFAAVSVMSMATVAPVACWQTLPAAARRQSVSRIAKPF